MSRLAFGIDFIIRSFFIFLVTYLWASYFFRSFALTFLSAFLVTVLVNVAIIWLQGKRKNRRTLSGERREHMGKIALQFRFMSQGESLLFIRNALREFEKNGKENSEQDEQKQDELTYTLFSLLHTNPTEADITEAIRRTEPGKKTVIIAHDFAPELRHFFGQLDIQLDLVNFEALYTEILDITKLYPPIIVEKKTSKRERLRELRNMFFSRRRARSFLFVGIFILFTSLIVRPTLYYVILATIVFGFAIIGFTRPREVSTVFAR